MYDVQVLRDAVIKLLISDHDFTIDDAEETVAESVRDHPEFWNENAEPMDLAKFLASDENDD